MNNFNLVISTATTPVYSGRAVYCKVTTPAGAIGIEAKHEPFLAVLAKNSSINYETETGDEKSVAVASALLSFKDNTCTIAAETTQ